MNKKLTTEEFIVRSNKIHNGKYDYSKVIYQNIDTKVCIVCPEHGEFWQKPYHHMNGVGCKKCSNAQKALTTEQFIEKAREIHGDRYDYSKVNYVNGKTKVCIICSEHGEFLQTPDSHLQGYGCAKCSNKEKLTTEEFIKRAREIHGIKYDYSKVDYVDCNTKVCIICPVHGEFLQTSSAHLRGNGCLKCKYDEQRLTTEQFIEKARKVHQDRYDYSKTIYGNTNLDKVCIICSEHGEFWQRPDKHLLGCGCPKCGQEIINDSQRLTKEEFIERALKKHGNKYDYSKVVYKNMYTAICIICPEHGEFWQTPSNHLRGNGCYKCFLEKRLLSLEQFIERARKIHGDKYDYSRVVYKGINKKVAIICPTHGEFLQTPHSHLYGNGCPTCCSSKLELQIRELLITEDMAFIPQYSFDELKTKQGFSQSLDFYLPQYNIAIECQGIQHFKPVDFGGKGEGWAKNNFKYIKELDIRKRKICEEKNIPILYFAKEKFDDNIITDTNELLEKIKNYYDKLRADAD